MVGRLAGIVRRAPWRTVALLLLLGGGAAAGWRPLRLNVTLRSLRHDVYSAEPAKLVSRLDELHEAYPADAEVTYLLAVACRRAARTIRARDLLGDAKRLGWPLSDLQRQEHLIRFQSGNIRESEAQLLRLIAQGPSDEAAAEIYECLVEGYFSDMRYNEVNLCLDHWLNWRPDSVRARLFKADLLNAVRDKRNEIEEYRKLVALEPDNVEFRMKLGYALLGVKDVSGALEQFNICSKLGPQDPGVLVGLASYYRHLGKMAEAREGLERALQADLSEAQQATAYFELGQLELVEKDYPHAVEHLRRALTSSSDNAQAHYSLGLALSRLGDKAAGNDHLEKSRTLAGQAQRFNDLMHAIIRDPENPVLRYETGEMLLDEGNSKEAFIWLASALRCDPRHRPTHKALARYYAEKGDEKMSRHHLGLAGQADMAEPDTLGADTVKGETTDSAEADTTDPAESGGAEMVKGQP
jgi:tetratricopeptide (TPR) repeat protein